ncbi:unnamed protein product [Phytophthora lilii]|uniref:Unnamed protein product n=1 Tax=Phytophthora lilii TaxID=2077276 RepID=A0A9W6TT53_9STRA|nr:unnamed protein product [Phytophthora lilii]
MASTLTSKILFTCLSVVFQVAALTSSSSGSVNVEVSLSSVSNHQAQQPLLNAVDWFLTEQEITDSRGGVPRSDLAVYTTGNAVTTYTVTKEFYDAVYEDLTQHEGRQPRPAQRIRNSPCSAEAGHRPHRRHNGR